MTNRANTMKNDPFAIKQYPKWSVFTAKARLIEQAARRRFHTYALPVKVIANLPPAPDVDYSNTAVTPIQMQHLLHALATTEFLKDTVVVEVGCYSGVTMQVLASATSRKVIAVDPYIGYGGNDQDYHHFQTNMAMLSNVIHERVTSGEAIRTWTHSPVSFIFIDAVHDYVNTAFDIKAWSSLMVKGGILAMHDTDQACFAGTRKAAFEACAGIAAGTPNCTLLFAHPANLTLLIKN
jgi:precorrin-6B methylase 2